MIPKQVEKALNKQIELESYASYLYLSMAVWSDNAGMDGCATFMFRQSVEENEHMMKILHYMLEMDATPIVPQITKPPKDFESIQKMMASVYAHEKKVTKSIHKLVDLSAKNEDHTTFNFLQWYVEEQREEENLMRGILDKIKIIGDGPQSLYFIDKEIEIINKLEESKPSTN